VEPVWTPPPTMQIKKLINSWGWGEIDHFALTGPLYRLRMIDDECGAVGGMRTDRGKRSTRRKLIPVPPSLPQIPHDLIWARTRSAALGSQRLTA
jgi:hypothetical protein